VHPSSSWPSLITCDHRTVEAVTPLLATQSKYKCTGYNQQGNFMFCGTISSTICVQLTAAVEPTGMWTIFI
jgi:hypothetical protein